VGDPGPSGRHTVLSASLDSCVNNAFSAACCNRVRGEGGRFGPRQTQLAEFEPDVWARRGNRKGRLLAAQRSSSCGEDAEGRISAPEKKLAGPRGARREGSENGSGKRTEQSVSQQQLPSQLPSVRSQLHEPTVVTTTAVTTLESTAVQSAMLYTSSALLATESAGLACAAPPGSDPAASAITSTTASTPAGRCTAPALALSPCAVAHAISTARPPRGGYASSEIPCWRTRHEKTAPAREAELASKCHQRHPPLPQDKSKRMDWRTPPLRHSHGKWCSPSSSRFASVLYPCGASPSASRFAL